MFLQENAIYVKDCFLLLVMQMEVFLVHVAKVSNIFSILQPMNTNVQVKQQLINYTLLIYRQLTLIHKV